MGCRDNGDRQGGEISSSGLGEGGYIMDTSDDTENGRVRTPLWELIGAYPNQRILDLVSKNDIGDRQGGEISSSGLGRGRLYNGHRYSWEDNRDDGGDCDECDDTENYWLRTPRWEASGAYIQTCKAKLKMWFLYQYNIGNGNSSSNY